MKTRLTFLTALLIGFLSSAQTIEKFSIDSGGASASAGGIQILYTIGEVNVQEYSNATLSVSEGFINPQQLIIKIDPKIFLEGPYNTAGTMLDGLRNSSLLPTTSPYIDAKTCAQSIFDVTGNNAIIDWVWLEIRDSSDGITVITSTSALLQANGNVVDVDGVSALTLNIPASNYYVVLAHRNHLGIRSANTISLTGGTQSIDLTGDSALIAGGANAITNLGDGNFALSLGDFDGNGQVQNSDLTGMLPSLGISSYSFADLDMNAQVQNTDISVLLPNLGLGSQAGRSENTKPIPIIIAPRRKLTN
ncbi:MAG: hemagglutinin protein [Flavobacteriaceae bacterium]